MKVYYTLLLFVGLFFAEGTPVTGNITLQQCEEHFLPPGVSFSAFEFLQDQRVCSGHGICTISETESYYCNCDDGWTGISEFVNADGYDCHINNLAITILWSFNLVFTLFYFVNSFPKMRTRFEYYFEHKQRRKEQGKETRLFKNKGLTALLLYYGVSFPSQVIFAILKIGFPTYRIGTSWVLSIFFALTKIGFYMGVTLFQPALLAAVLKGLRATRRIVDVSNQLSKFAFVIAVLLSLLPLVILIVDPESPTVQRNVFLTYCFGTCVHLIGLLVQGIVVKTRVNYALDKSYSITQMEKTKKMREKVCTMQDETIRQCFFQSIIYLFFGLFPFMWTKHDYVLPILWLAIPLVGAKCARTVVSKQEIATSKQTGNSKTGGNSTLGINSPRITTPKMSMDNSFNNKPSILELESIVSEHLMDEDESPEMERNTLPSI